MSRSSPINRATSSASPESLSTMGAERRHCHTMAFITGFPVSRSQRMVVSRWFVMPTAATSEQAIPLFSMASAALFSSDSQISVGSCSTHPSLG